MKKPCLRKKVRIRFGKNDSAVAEIIGTVLIFAIAISLFTTFILWYVPATGTANEQHYDQQTQNAFYRFAGDISTGHPKQGESVTDSFPMGIQGVPPFSPPYSSSISFSRSGQNFSAHMSYGISVLYETSGGNVSYYNHTYTMSGRGEFSSFAPARFTTPTSYIIQDGFIIQTQGNANPAIGLGPLPLEMNISNSGSEVISAEVYNFTGQSTVASSVQSSLISVSYNTVNGTSFTEGDLASINGTVATIRGITLDYFYYNVSSPYVNQWNYVLYREYNDSSATYQAAKSISSWNFSAMNFTSTMSGNTISISSTATMNPVSTDIHYLGITVNSV